MTATAQTPDLTANQLHEQALTRQLLESLLTEQRYEITQVVVGNFDRREAVLLDSPGPRAKRLIIPRYGQGANNYPVGTTITEIVEQDEGRLGGNIVNTGTVDCRLYLATPGDVGGVGAAPNGQSLNRPSIYLVSGGGSWDFRFGNVLYGGTVCAVGLSTGTTLDWATF